MGTQPDVRQTQGDVGREWKRMTGALPEPARAEDRDDLVWQQMTAIFAWYDKSATRSRLLYQCLKLAALVAGAAVTVLAAISAPAALTASLAGLIVVVEGAQQLFQFHPNWISYRSTAEALRQQAFLYAAGVGPFDDETTRRELLATSLRDLTMRENAAWTSTMRQAQADSQQT
jgi:hypothetical protein